MSEVAQQNYYEILQLSPDAEPLVITKVYRLLAAYYHPDNKQTGDEEKFKQVLKAYEVLSDPAKRSTYDLEFFARDTKQAKNRPTDYQKSNLSSARQSLQSKLGNLKESDLSDDNHVSERELRKHMLLALYDIRRNNPGNPEVSLLVLSELLGCKIDNLEFPNWYLKEKGLIKISESADFSITVAGVDYVEKELLVADTETNALFLPQNCR